MKKLSALLLTAILIVSCMPMASAVQNVSDLPFELIPSKMVYMAKTEGETSPSLCFTYSMESDMIQFMDELADSDKRDALLNRLNVDDIWIDAQIDWNIDNTGWHYNSYWDTDGYDEDYNLRTSEWDVVSVLLYPQTTNDCWITRGCGDINDPDNSTWNGWGTQPGLRDVLDQIQDIEGTPCYTVIDNGDGTADFTIDYSKHTVYARMRYFVTVRPTNGEEFKLFSDWSDSAAYGKDAPKWEPYTAESLNPPVISNAYITDELFNDYPVASYTLTVPDDLAEGLTRVSAAGGGIRIETEGRVKGTATWIGLQGDITIKSGEIKIDLLNLTGAGQPLYANTEIELRAHFWCNQYSESGEWLGDFYSGYSNVLTVKTDKDYKVSSQPSTDSTEPVAISEPPIHNLNNGASQSQVIDYVQSLKNDLDPTGGTFGLLSACQKTVTKNKIAIKWNKLKKAKKYLVFGNKCGKKNPYKLLATVKGTSYTQSKLTKGTYYKYLVVAFDSKGKSISTSKTLHIATKGGKVCNFKTVTTAAKKNKVTLKKGKSFKLKAKAIIENKKLEVRVHRKLKYESSNPKIATVSGGKITGRKKGTCYVYVYAQSGAYKKIKVTVK